MTITKTTPSPYVRVSFLAHFPITKSVGASRWFETEVLSGPWADMVADAGAQLRQLYGEATEFEIRILGTV